MKITIIIPTKNRGLSLSRTLSLLIEQLTKEDEIIVADNGKGSYKYVQPLLRENKSILYLNVNTNGPALARNMGIKRAKGDILVFLDDDCLVNRDWLKTIRIFYKEKKNINVILQGKIIHKYIKHTIFEDIIKYKNKFNFVQINSNEKYINYINAGNFACSKEVADRYDEFFDWENFPFICEEKDLAEKLNLDGYKIYFSDLMSVLHVKQSIHLFKRLKIAYLYGFYTGRVFLKYESQNKNDVQDLFSSEINTFLKKKYFDEYKFIINSIEGISNEVITGIYLIIRETIYKIGYFLGKNIFPLNR